MKHTPYITGLLVIVIGCMVAWGAPLNKEGAAEPERVTLDMNLRVSADWQSRTEEVRRSMRLIGEVTVHQPRMVLAVAGRIDLTAVVNGEGRDLLKRDDPPEPEILHKVRRHVNPWTGEMRPIEVSAKIPVEPGGPGGPAVLKKLAGHVSILIAQKTQSYEIPLDGSYQWVELGGMPPGPRLRVKVAQAEMVKPGMFRLEVDYQAWGETRAGLPSTVPEGGETGLLLLKAGVVHEQGREKVLHFFGIMNAGPHDNGISSGTIERRITDTRILPRLRKHMERAGEEPLHISLSNLKLLRLYVVEEAEMVPVRFEMHNVRVPRFDVEGGE